MIPPAGGRAPAGLLIRDAELGAGRRADVRLKNGRIETLGRLLPVPGERVIEAAGSALLPGLHDHHLHLYALAASRESLPCGPPAVRDADALTAALSRRAATAAGWIRGVGYHESVAGELGRAWLDERVPDVPVRVQHRSGRLWVLNTVGIDRLFAAAAARGVPAPAVDPGSGRLYDADGALRRALGAEPPDLRAVSGDLAACGVTGVTDMTPDNDAATFEGLVRAQTGGALLQRLLLAGRPDLHTAGPGTPWAVVGPVKFHLHESALPPFDGLCRTVAGSHERGRTVAFHCVTETELVFALAALTEAGARPGDRIEHASVTPDPLLEQIRGLGLTVVTQPNFVAERGDAYLADVPVADRPHLYRARSFLAAGVPLAGGSDAPFGRPDPWFAMRAAVERRTADGQVLGAAEALSPEAALALFAGEPGRPGAARSVQAGVVADLVLLDRPWRQARSVLCRDLVRMTLIDGVIVCEPGPAAQPP